MKTLLDLEDLAKFTVAYILTLALGFQWWVFFAWLLAPDVSMIGYLINTKLGAWLYNVVHHQAVAIAVGITGLYLGDVNLQFAGLLLFGHSAMDRIFGYGLKFEDSFHHTHLGMLGKKVAS
jgi:multisubunit Na+/H+ antiporter MnhB subunit